MSREWSAAARKEIEAILTRYPTKRAAMLPVLRVAEREFGAVDEAAMVLVAATLDVTPAEVQGVVSFYTHLRRPHWGRHVIQVCSTLSCALRGSETLADHLQRRLGIRVGETTPDRKFTLLKVECLARCGEAPAMQVNDETYLHLTPEKVDRILEELP